MRLLSLLMLFISCYSFAQEQQGYYITTSNQRVEGYFKTTDFLDSNSLQFKKSASDAFTALPPENIKEYGVGSAYKFVKQTVKVDKSDNYNARLYSSVKDPKFITETVFLNVILEGQYASLYAVNVNKSIRYFYTLEDKNNFSQLLYKKFSSAESVISHNRLYQRQLFTDLNCNGESMEKFNSIDYTKEELLAIFRSFNQCKGSSFIEYSNKGAQTSRIVYTVFGGIYSSTLQFQDSRLPEASKASLSYGLGVEIALAFPSGLEFFARGEFEIYNQEASTGNFRTSYNEQNVTTTVNTTAISGYVGPRYNFRLDDKNKLFVDAAIGLNFYSGDIKMGMIATPLDGTPYQLEERSYSPENTNSS